MLSDLSISIDRDLECGLIGLFEYLLKQPDNPGNLAAVRCVDDMRDLLASRSVHNSRLNAARAATVSQ